MTKFKVIRYWDTYPDGVVFGCIIAFLTIDFIIGAHFGIQYGFLSMAAELIICGLLLIKFGDK